MTPHRIIDRSIVIIEDSDEDFEVTVWALRQAGITNSIHRCAKIADINALWVGPPNWPATLLTAYPLLVLLDLNIPGADWGQTLSRLRSNQWWQPVPVVIISTSEQHATVSACYCSGAAGYLKKPVDLDTFAEAIRDVVKYWLKVVVLPQPYEDGGIV